jgi:RHS repeat-associated protein
MPTISISQDGHLKPRAHAPAGGPNLIASFKNDVIGQSATSFASSTKVVHGEEAYTQAEVTTLYHGNQQYSVTALSDSSGNVSERYTYTAYGQPTFLNASGTVQTSSAASNRYTYTGREWDSTLGLHHFRARWMSGVSGRFLTRDPIGYRDGLSVYRFLRNQSLSSRDPNGFANTKEI